MLSVKLGRIGSLVAVVAAVAFAGCGGGSVSTVPVSGTVTLDGKPLAGATVNFATKDFAAQGKTDSKGKFTLVQGAQPGANAVFISKIEGDFEEKPEEGLDRGQLEAAAAGHGDIGAGLPKLKGEVVPAEFSDPMKSTLQYTVPDGGTDSANFNLTTPE